MAELATIMAGFGWYFMARNGLKMVRRDIELWQGYNDFVTRTENQFMISDGKLKVLQQKWMLYEGMPDALYKTFWGETGWTKLKASMDIAKAEAIGVINYLSEERCLADTKTVDEELKKRGLSKLIHKARQHAKTTRHKASHVIFERYGEKVKNLIGHIDEIGEVAKIWWGLEGQEKKDGRQGDPNEENIYQLAVKTSISRFAVKTRTRSRDLFKNWAGDVGRLHMALDMLSMASNDDPARPRLTKSYDVNLLQPSEHIRAIATACMLTIPEFIMISAKDSITTQGSTNRVVAVKEVQRNEAGCIHVTDAIRKAAAGDGTSKFSIHGAGGQGSTFEVSQRGDVQALHMDAKTLLSRCMAGPRNAQRRMKLKLAYELSMAYFTLYFSDWAHRVCLENIGFAKMRDATPDGSWTADTICVNQICTGATGPCSVCQFASQSHITPAAKTLRRFGLLLIQIACDGEQITKVKLDPENRKIVAVMVGPKEHRRDALSKRIKEGIDNSDKFIDAVEFCLDHIPSDNQNPEERELTKTLGTFYEAVVRVIGERYKAASSLLYSAEFEDYPRPEPSPERRVIPNPHSSFWGYVDVAFKLFVLISLFILSFRSVFSA
ncbi:hypothetical protein GQ53DRAFT_825764 [Thozetella sp. PMI_491]|nr:hypothetical protein GQ53DRAFT_825764 [Thozetella sp. PMI_491]